jgi:hypothetical protein
MDYFKIADLTATALRVWHCAFHQQPRPNVCAACGGRWWDGGYLAEAGCVTCSGVVSKVEACDVCEGRTPEQLL